MRLDPTTGSEMRKTRPCVVVSRDAMNARLRTVLVAPLTRGGFEAPFRVVCKIAGQEGQIALDQMRVVDKAMQILGGYGFISEFPIERMYRDMKGIEFGAGTTQIQKLIIIQELMKKFSR